MIWKTTLAIAAVGLISLGPAMAKSPTEPKPAAKARSQCFWTHQVNNFASTDDRIVNLRVGVRDVYQLEMLGRCTDID